MYSRNIAYRDKCYMNKQVLRILEIYIYFCINTLCCCCCYHSRDRKIGAQTFPSSLTILYYVHGVYFIIFYVLSYVKFTQLSHETIRNTISVIVSECRLLLSTTVLVALTAQVFFSAEARWTLVNVRWT